MVDKLRLYYVLIAIGMVISLGTTGYYFIYKGDASIIDCLYMTVISLTSVGYGEVLQVTGNIKAQVFTMILILFGMGVIVYGVSNLTATIIEGDLSGILRNRQMEKKIKQLKGHLIVCGGGETGSPLIAELLHNKEAVVLIEQNEEVLQKNKGLGDILYILGDATEDENLIAAGIHRAKGILITLPSDKDTLYVTMTARMLNSKIRIISRMVTPKLMPKLKKAGADGVVSPNIIGALRMASQMIRPAAVDFLDQMLRSSGGDLRIHEIIINEKSSIAGQKIKNSGLKDKYNILVLALKKDVEEVIFNPSPDLILSPGMTLIVMGDMNTIGQMRSAL